MRFSNLLYFYRLRLRTRLVSELFALIGIAGGVALLFAAQVANTSLTGSVEQLVEGAFGRADSQLVARGPQGFDERLLDRVRALPGVRSAAPLLEVRANAVGPGGRRAVTVLGTDHTLAGVAGPELRRFRTTRLPGARFIALPMPLAQDIGVPLGGRLRLEIGATTARVRLAAELAERQIGPLALSPLAVAPLRYAQELGSMRGQLTRVLVEAAPSRATNVERELNELAGEGFNVRPGDFDVALFRQAAAPTSQSTALFAAISALVGFLFAFNAMLLTLADRRRLIAALRTDGYRPRVVLQVVLFDALVLGVVASAAGLLLGNFVSGFLFEEVPGYLSAAFPIGEQRIVTWQSAAVAAAGGIGATVLAALLPVADILRRRPLASGDRDAKRPSRLTRLMPVAGLAALACSVTVLVLAPEAALLGVVTLVAALMLTLPAGLSVVLAVADRVLAGVRGPLPTISIGELRAMSARSVAVAATGALAVFGAVAIQGARDDLQEGLDRATRDVNGVADIWVSASGEANTFATTPFEMSAAKALRQLGSVRAARLHRSGFLDLDDRRVWVVAPPRTAAHPLPPSQLPADELALATSRLRQGGWVTVSEVIADERGWSVGETVTLPTPRPSSFRVAALTKNIGWAPGAVVINADDYARAWGSRDPTALHVMLTPGASPELGRREVARALGAGGALTVETGRQRIERHYAASRQGLARLSQLAVLVLVAAVLAMAAATGGMLWQRRSRLAGLKLDGLTTGTVWRALLLESALLLGAGCLTGALFGLLGQRLLDRALGAVTGYPVVDSLALEVAIGSFALVAVVAVSIAALPGYIAARVPPGSVPQE